MRQRAEQLGHDLAGPILYDGAPPGGAGIAARATVYIRRERAHLLPASLVQPGVQERSASSF
jgi:hypothetical protein